MAVPPLRMVKYSLQVKFALLIAMLVVLIVIGNWIAFQQTRTMLLNELEKRGLWITRNLAYNSWYGLLTHNKGWIDDIVTGVLHEDDVLYVAIFTPDSDVFLFKSQELQAAPEILQNLLQNACQSPDPQIHSQIIVGQTVSIVEAPVVKNAQPWSRTVAENSLEQAAPQNSATTPAAFSATCLGTIQVGLSQKTLGQQLTRILLTFLLLCTLVIGIGVLGYWSVSRMLVSPLVQMVKVATNISEGDLRQTLHPVAFDEVGALEKALSRILKAFRLIAERLKQACDQIKSVADTLWDMAEELSDTSQQQSASIYHISKNIAANADRSQTIADNSERVATVAAATLDAIHQAEITVNHTIASMQEIRAQTEHNNERAVLLGEKIGHISTVVKIINTIADQTRLIAFNASIEATGAGEAGARFSIVATEVRRLANMAMEALEEIREVVASVQAATNELIVSSETGIRKVNQGVASITETGQTLQHILTLMDQTTQSAQEISISTQHQQTEYDRIAEAIRGIADGSEQVVDTSKRTTTIVKDLRDLANTLDSVVQKFVTQ